jgi:hypothetical protein
MARIHNHIARETVLKRKWLDIMIDSELAEESQGMASTEQVIRLVPESYRTVFGILQPVLRYGRIPLRPVTTTVRHHGAGPWFEVHEEARVS